MKKDEATEKPISELSASEILDILTERNKAALAIASTMDNSRELSIRLGELTKPIVAMSIEELQKEIEALDVVKQTVIKPFYDRRKEVINALHMMTGPGIEWDGDEPAEDSYAGHHWQDAQGRVWCTENVTGTFVEFRDFDVTRTRDKDLGEVKGFSMSKARKLGYEVEGK